MTEDEKRLQEEKAKHAKTKKTIKTVGLVLVICGAILDIVFFVDIFASMSSFGAPNLFFCGFIGFPMTGIGAMLLSIGFRKEINSYMKNENVPVVNDAVQELKPAVKAVAEAVKEVGSEVKTESAKTTVCPSCGKVNQPENNFCDGCGTQLFKLCPNCGARQEADDVFCGQCGGKL